MIELPEGAVVLDGLDEAIIGETTRDGLSVLGYFYRKGWNVGTRGS